MNPPYIDVHTHNCRVQEDVIPVCVYDLLANADLPEGQFVAGVHPWNVATALPEDLDFFEEPHPGLVGVGEIGLDFSYTEMDKNHQLTWFRRQVEIAERMELPVVLHCVKAYNEVLSELKKYRLRAVIFHGFIGSLELMNQLVKQGYYLSFGLSAFTSPKTLLALENTPLSHLFLETDDNNLTNIKNLYEKISILREISIEKLKLELFINYKKVFNG